METCKVRTPMQDGGTDVRCEHQCKQQWTEMATDEYIQIMRCVLFLLRCFCCEECCFCFFFTGFFHHRISFKSNLVSHTTDFHGHVCSSRTKHHKHKLYQHMYSYNRTGSIIRPALLLRNKTAIEHYAVPMGANS